MDRRGSRPAPARSADLAEAEYKVEAGLEAAPFDTARWVRGPEAALKNFTDFNMSNLAKDRDGDPVFLARSAWDVSYQQEKNPEVFSATEGGNA